MMMRTLALLSCWLLVACSNEPLAKDRDGKYAIISKCAPSHLAQAIEDHPQATLIIDFGPNSPNLAETTQATKRATAPFAISVGEAPQSGQDIADAVIVVDTGAEAAVDLALLACNGVPLQPNRIEVGTRTITKANRAAGGSPRVAPGDVLLAMLRMQHTDILTTTPDTDVIHTIGLIQCQPDSQWQTDASRAVATAASRYPQVKLHRADTSGEAPTPVEQAARHVNTVRVLVVATSDPAQTKAIAEIAAKGPDGAVPIIVLDPTVQAEHGACVIGCSAEVLGEATAAVVHELLPEGGSMIASFGQGAEPRVRGFCAAMGFAPDRLLSR